VVARLHTQPLGEQVSKTFYFMKYSELIWRQTNLLPIVVILICCFSCDQNSKVENLKANPNNKSFATYNHTAFVVKNLDSSITFYNYVFEFDTIHYPFPYRENIRAKWMSIGNGGELHLGEFKGDTTAYYYPGHIGFTVTSIDSILSRLKVLKY
jgi:hypothetical protein